MNGTFTIDPKISEVLDTVTELAPSPIEQPMPKVDHANKALVGFLTRASTVSLDATKNNNITVVLGPKSAGGYREKNRWVNFNIQTDSQNVYNRMWANPVEKVMTLHLGAVDFDNGRPVAQKIEPIMTFDHNCACGAVDTFRTVIVKLKRRAGELKCSGCGRHIGSAADLEMLAAENPSAVANGEKVRLYAIPGSNIVEIKEGCRGGIQSRPSDQLRAADGDTPARGTPITSGFSEVEKTLKTTDWAQKMPLEVMASAVSPDDWKEGDPTPDDILLAKFRLELDLLRGGKSMVDNMKTLPDLLGLFSPGQAPYVYALSEREKDLEARHAYGGKPVEIRPYRALRGLRNLPKCDWVWLLHPTSTGWIKTTSLSSRDDADDIESWNPGFKYRLTPAVFKHK